MVNVRLPGGVFGTVVGRSVLFLDVQLRPFSVDKPWTRSAAENHSLEALTCWEDENNTPSLDKPPHCNVETQKCVDTLLGLIPPEDTPFQFELWAEIPDRKNVFVKSTGGVFEAAHLYVSAWRQSRNPTTLTPRGA